MEAIENGLDRTVGPDSKLLILKMLKTTYSLDNITSNLERFEELLTRFLGIYSARIVKERIILEMQRLKEEAGH